MPIGSYGGLEIGRGGGRVIRGSGGMVGGLSRPGRNYAYLMGAGDNYYSFTPVQGENQIPTPTEPTPENPNPNPGGGGGGTTTGGGGGGTTTGGGGGTTTGGGGGGTTTGGGGGTGTARTLQTLPTTIVDLVRSLMQTTEQPLLGDSSPLYLFTPAQPVESSGGLNVKNLLVIGAVVLGGWWIYKRVK